MTVIDLTAARAKRIADSLDAFPADRKLVMAAEIVLQLRQGLVVPAKRADAISIVRDLCDSAFEDLERM